MSKRAAVLHLPTVYTCLYLPAAHSPTCLLICPPALLSLRPRSHGLSGLTADDDLALRQHSNSEHGGRMYQQFMQKHSQGTTASEEVEMGGQPSFKLFGDVGPMALSNSGLGSGPVDGSGDLQDRRKSFKLFGDVEPLALSASGLGSGPVGSSGEADMAGQRSFRLFGDVEPLALSTSGLVGSGAVGSSSGEADMAEQRPFRLFGDVEPLALSTSGAVEGMAAEGEGGGGEDRAAPRGDSSKAELEPEQSFRLFGPGGISPLRLRCGQHCVAGAPAGLQVLCSAAVCPSLP